MGLVLIVIIGIVINLMGRIYSTIPMQRAMFDKVDIVTFNFLKSMLEPAQDIKKQVLPITAEYQGREAALSSPYLVVQNYSNVSTNNELRVYNLATGNEDTVPTRGKHIWGFDVEGANVVWADLRNEIRDPMRQEPSGQYTYKDSELNWDVFLYNLETKELKQLTHEPAAQRNPRVWQHYVVWEDNRDDTTDDNYGVWNIYLYDLESGEEARITSGESDHIHPRIRDGKVVWQDSRNNMDERFLGCGNCPENNWDIYLYDILTGDEQAVAIGPTMECDPDVSGDLVVWAEYRDLNNADILMKELDSGEVTKVTDDYFHQWQPRVDNGRVVWTDERRGHSINDVNTGFANADVLLYDTPTGNSVRLTGDWIQSQPLISGPYVAFLYDTQAEPCYQVVRLPDKLVP
ncbi:MAG: Protein TolB [Pelotomaculum sp. PtaU1.Bin035]|nr:MAG: Protein TolB [Pelotomaculum sp. PtaU1.Bin035]